jgi:drug/metabolite transporter (DMT)-like permease
MIAYPRRVSRPEPKPLDPPMVPFAVVGIAIWAVLGLALLPFHGWLSQRGHTNWLWTCLAGFLLGFVGLAVMIRHDRRRRRTRRLLESINRLENGGGVVRDLIE